jgi:hypothetical protein
MIPEVKGYLDAIEGLRGAMRRAVEGVDAQGLNWNPLPGEANSLYAIVSHMCFSEPALIHTRITGQPMEGGYPNVFASRGDDPQELFSRLDQVGQTTHSLMEGLTAEDMDRSIDPGGGRPSRTLREWIIVHLRHQALHLGHIEITKQLYEAGVVAGR